MIGKEKEIIYVKEQIKVYFNIKDIGDIDFVIGIKFKKNTMDISCNNEVT